jgi:hypoxanthine-guanine phosphoribosyltransferase
MAYQTCYRRRACKFFSNLSGGIISSIAAADASSTKIEFVWIYHDMVSAIVERVEFCNNEILLAGRYLDEIIINSVLRKANSLRIIVLYSKAV